LALPAEDREQVFFYSVAATTDDREQRNASLPRPSLRRMLVGSPPKDA